MLTALASLGVVHKPDFTAAMLEMLDGREVDPLSREGGAEAVMDGIGSLVVSYLERAGHDVGVALVDFWRVRASAADRERLMELWMASRANGVAQDGAEAQ